MPSKVDEQIPRSVMFLCLGTAFVLLLGQWAGTTNLLTRPSSATGIVRPNRPTPSNSQPAKEFSSRPGDASAKLAQTAPKTNSKLVVNLSDRRVYLYKSAQLQASYPLAVAQAGWETPTGSFQVLNMERDPTWVHPITGVAVPPGSDNPLGVAWIGFWTDGKTEIGFHGTNQEELIGAAVSHGCLRMRNADIQAVYAQVSEGTPVEVQQ